MTLTLTNLVNIHKPHCYLTDVTDLPKRDQITKGCTVSIETKKDQGTGRLTDGIVQEILTSSESHPHGIKVRLENDQIGRVKKIQSNNQIVNTKTEKFPDIQNTNIPKTEDKYNEFKEFLQYDTSIDKLTDNPEKSKVIENIKHKVQERFVQAICSFGNAYEGGTIYLGIKSDGTISGLEQDKKLQGISDYNDEFANHIRTVLEKFLDDKVFLTSKLAVKFQEINKKTIGIVQVLPSDTPLYLKGDKEKMFFVRGFAPRAEKLEDEEQVRYIKQRFPNFE